MLTPERREQVVKQLGRIVRTRTRQGIFLTISSYLEDAANEPEVQDTANLVKLLSSLLKIHGTCGGIKVPMNRKYVKLVSDELEKIREARTSREIVLAIGRFLEVMAFKPETPLEIIALRAMLDVKAEDLASYDGEHHATPRTT